MSAAKTCLLIDDDQDDQEIFLIALSDSGQPVNCITADSALTGLQQLDKDPTHVPDCIFVDLNMPGMNGRQCLLEIKKRNYLKDVPVVIYSTSSQSHDISEFIKLGATDFITKPSSIKLLSAILIDFFKKHL